MYHDYCLALDNYEILQKETEGAIAVIRSTPLAIFAKGLDENLCRSYEGRSCLRGRVLGSMSRDGDSIGEGVSVVKGF